MNDNENAYNTKLLELKRQLGEIQIAQKQATDILIEQLAEIKRIREEFEQLRSEESRT